MPRLPRREAAAIRRTFFRALLRNLRITWPILSGLLTFQIALGASVGLIEGWGISKGLYFAAITGLTIGYGDLVPRGPLARTLAVLIGCSGIVLAGLVVALAVRALQSVTPDGPAATKAGESDHS